MSKEFILWINNPMADYFDNIDYDDFFEEPSAEINQETEQTLQGNVGDLVYYDLLSNEFGIASAVVDTKLSIELMNNWRIIVLGTVINQDPDTLLVDVLMGGFLMKEPQGAPVMYYEKDKRPYLRAYAYDLFKRFVKKFFQSCPGYQPLLRMTITMPTVTDMIKVQEHFDDIFRTLSMTCDKNVFWKFRERLYNNFIFVKHKTKMYQMRIQEDPEQKPEVVIPMASIPIDFLCVFRNIDVFHKVPTDPSTNAVDPELAKVLFS